MRNHRERMEQIRRCVSRYRRRKERQLIGCLCMLSACLSGAMGHLLDRKQQPGIFTMQSEYGSVLLHSSGQPYIVIGVVAFIAGAAFTIACIRLSRRKKIRNGEEGQE